MRLLRERSRERERYKRREDEKAFGVCRPAVAIPCCTKKKEIESTDMRRKERSVCGFFFFSEVRQTAVRCFGPKGGGLKREMN